MWDLLLDTTAVNELILLQVQLWTSEDSSSVSQEVWANAEMGATGIVGLAFNSSQRTVD